MAVFPYSARDDVEGWIGTPSSSSRDTSRPSGPCALAGPPRSDRQGADLATLVESQIIPRLMLAHRSDGAEAGARPKRGAPLGPQITEIFARMVVAKEPDSLIAFVGGLLRDGLSMEAIYADLLAPTARRLGDYWDQDIIAFTDVTIGLGRLQQVVRALGWRTPSNGESDRMARAALFAPGPGEQHTFGLFIVEDVFRRAGWQTWMEGSAPIDAIVDIVGRRWFDVFGLSLSRESPLDEVAASLAAIRRASRNPDIFMLAGGRLFLERPDLAARIGADATAASGDEALVVANEARLAGEEPIHRVASAS